MKLRLTDFDWALTNKLLKVLAPKLVSNLRKRNLSLPLSFGTNTAKNTISNSVLSDLV